ncbi:centrosomal protein CEP57L1 isoform X7 [Notamacropus eugenii]|uniref:centrosomal protein CEP57L1 isoform X7 n=1 Tax=Notamacropus eugenii TaxID=9315 RepID=UPI003B684149
MWGSDEIMYAEFKHSLIGSYLKPPDKITNPSFAYCEAVPQANLPKKLQPLSTPNSHAILLALKTLQDKIHQLELERTQAEDNLNTLSQEAALYKKALLNENNERDLAHQELIKQRKDISAQLSATQTRCSILEKQLELTKKMVLNAEQEKNFTLQPQQGKKSSKRGFQQTHSKFGAIEKSANESHFVNASVQTILNMMKHGSSPSLQACPEASERRAISKRTVRCRSTSSYSSKSSSIGDSLTDLVMAMQDELDEMSVEHQELLKQVQESPTLLVNEEIEYELECLARKMEMKGEQIFKLKKYQDHVNKLQQKCQNSKSEVFSTEPKDENHKGTKNVPVMVVTRKGTNKAKPPQKSCSCQMPQKCFQKIRMTLRKDDVKWEQ